LDSFPRSKFTSKRKALTSRFCLKSPVLVKRLAKVAGELAFLREIWYYRTLS
jgi:hypothetical protein